MVPPCGTESRPPLSAVTSASKGFARSSNAAIQNPAGISALVPLEGLIDPAAETVRINEQIGKVEKELKGLMGRLNSKGFTDKAPASVIQDARDKQAGLEDKKTRLQNALAALSG